MNKKIEKLIEKSKCNAIKTKGIENIKDNCYIVSSSNLKDFADLIIAECITILISNEGNEKTVDAIWDLGELGVDVSKVLDAIKK